ncbi:MAG: HAD family hydrolase [Planctomycetaceae bacterium]|nr:HAD family hydrolase [Planctomycetaceae bacterium]
MLIVSVGINSGQNTDPLFASGFGGFYTSRPARFTFRRHQEPTIQGRFPAKSRFLPTSTRAPMALSLAEYSDSLDERNLLWPRVQAVAGVNATPTIKPLAGVKLVLWDVFGTLIRITDGKIGFEPSDEARLQIALDKTIHEFNMWNHMYRRPGPPWQSLISLYRDIAGRLSMIATERRGDYTEVDMVDVWQSIITRLFEKEYQFDEGHFGNLRQFSEKVAFFFHRNLQATEARENAVRAMHELASLDVLQGLLADGQSYSLVQVLHDLGQQDALPPLHEIFRPETLLFSTQLGIRKPSKTLFEYAVSRARSIGIPASAIVHVSCRLSTDLAPAKAAGMKTILLAAEKTGLEVSSAQMKDPATRPDRLITNLNQLSSIVGPA